MPLSVLPAFVRCQRYSCGPTFLYGLCARVRNESEAGKCETEMTSQEKEIDSLKKLSGGEWECFRFFEHQLGVLDGKAQAIMSLDGMLLALTSSILGSLIALKIEAPFAMHRWAFCSILIGSALVAASAIADAIVLRTKWATSIMANAPSGDQGTNPGLNELVQLRDEKTSRLDLAIVFLVSALLFYFAAVFFFLT
mgnify:CR=1 FL=1